jgi:CrcB protein
MWGYFLVFLGGGLGSMCRYGIAHLLERSNTVFPYATLLANILSCIVLGIFLGWSLKGGMHHNYRFLVMTGFCGGFSTFSTFSSETFLLIQSGHWGLAFVNVLGSVFVCLGAVYLGLRVVYW